HFGIVPVERGLKMTPVESRILFLRCAEPLIDAPQTADVLPRDAADEPAPRFIRVLAHRNFLRDERLAPLDDTPPLLPLGRADDPAPAADVRLRSFDQRITERLECGS